MSRCPRIRRRPNNANSPRSPHKTRSKKPSPSRLRCDQQQRLKAWRVRSRNQSLRRSRRRRRRTDRAGLAGARARSRLRRGILRRCFGPVAALQYSRPVAQDHQTFWIIFNGGFVERARRAKLWCCTSTRSMPARSPPSWNNSMVYLLCTQ